MVFHKVAIEKVSFGRQFTFSFSDQLQLLQSPFSQRLQVAAVSGDGDGDASRAFGRHMTTFFGRLGEDDVFLRDALLFAATMLNDLWCTVQLGLRANALMFIKTLATALNFTVYWLWWFQVTR